MTDWEGLKRDLQKYICQCGSGGSMACDEDCPGDVTPNAVREALIAIIEHIESANAETQAD